MPGLKIQLLVFEGCPLADAARTSLRRAISRLGLEYEEIDLLAPGSPEDLRRWGSPTILVNGEDVGGASRAQGVGCRIYGAPGSVPSAESVVAAIERARAANG